MGRKLTFVLILVSLLFCPGCLLEWSNPEQVGQWMVRAGTSLSAAQDDNGFFHVAYDLNVGSTGDVGYSTNVSGTWTSEIVNRNHHAVDPILSVEDGVVYMLYNRHDIIPPGIDFKEIRYVNNKNGSWMSDVVMSHQAMKSAFLEGSRAWAAYYYDDPVIGAKFLRLISNESGSWVWENIQRWYTGDWPEENVLVKLNPNGYASLVYSSGADNQIEFAWKNQGQWHHNLVPDSELLKNDKISLAFDPDWEPHIVWESSYGDISYADSSYGVWTQAKILIGTGSNWFHPFIGFNHNGIPKITVGNYPNGLHWFTIIDYQAMGETLLSDDHGHEVSTFLFDRQSGLPHVFYIDYGFVTYTHQFWATD